MYDEYFCPNCNATLNNQYGFDPNAGSWTCKQCGTHLFDSAYGGNRFDNVSWYCDSCGAFLNKQSGFSDSYEYWNCTECGYSNHISDDEIRRDNHHSNSSNGSSSVGALDVANSLLNLLNSIADIAIDIKKNKDRAAQEEAQRIERDKESSPVHTATPRQNTRAFSKSACVKKLSDEELKKIRRKAFFRNGKRLQVGYDPYNLLHKNVADAYTMLHNRGFNNIKKIAVRDIYVNSKYAVGEVEQIVIGGSQYFESTDMVPYDTEIIIVHHQKQKIKIPFSADSLRGMNYITAGDKLQELGFTQIYERKLKDMFLGLLRTEGSVEKVTISNNSFNKNTSHEYDAEIMIEYHSY